MKSRKIEDKDIKVIFSNANSFLIGTDDLVKPKTDEECEYALRLAEKCFVSWFKNNFKVETIERYDEDEVIDKLAREVAEKAKLLIEDIEKTVKEKKKFEEEAKKDDIGGKMLNSFLERLKELFSK